MIDKRLGFIGTGKIGSVIIESLINSKTIRAKNISASNRSKEKLDRVVEKTGINRVENNKRLVDEADIVLLAVRPQDVDSALDGIKIKKQLLVSIVTGLSTRYLEEKFGGARVVRAMPNLCCSVGESATCYFLGRYASEGDDKLVQELFSSIGICYKVQEEWMNAVTALSGAGPAYFAYFIRSIAKAGMMQGLPKILAYELAEQTAIGTGRLLKSGTNCKDLINRVCTPAGITIEGMEVLEDSSIGDIVVKTVGAASQRAKELSKG